jgi:putative ABC transport system permease protein
MQQSFTESGLLAVTGGLLGLATAFAVTKVPIQAWPEFLEAPANVHLSPGVLLFTGALVILTSLLFGIVTALKILRQSATHFVQQDARTMSESWEQRVIRSGLMVAEIAFATLLVGGAMGMAFYFSQLLHTDPGVRTDHVLSMDVSLSPIRYARKDDQRPFFHSLEEKLSTLPGVEAAGGVSAAPFSGNAESTNYTYDGDPIKDPAQMAFADTYFVTPGYLNTMQITLRQGRLLNGQDTASSPKVLVINQSMAAKLWPNQSAIGKRIKIMGGNGRKLWAWWATFAVTAWLSLQVSRSTCRQSSIR